VRSVEITASQQSSPGQLVLDGIDIALYYAVRGPQSLADVRINYSPGPTPNIEFLNNNNNTTILNKTYTT